RLNPLGGAPVEMWTTHASPTVPQENKTGRSGHLMCYQNRTSSFAIDSAHLRISPIPFAQPDAAAG
ncbi:MAG TPA: hypothetical protein VN637_09975, partial [Roseiarcus sp.]|nr:hypothetical protein [Roseiarcus sp.]